MEKKFKYIEIIKMDNKEVVKRSDVSDKSDRSIERIEMGMNINLNHKEYMTNINESETELTEI
jgi:hypothetical protein